MRKGALHPFLPCGIDTVKGVDFILSSEKRRLMIRYNLHGDLDRLALLPGEVTRRDWRCDGLWRHTCFELFIKPEGEHPGGYFECNFSPSGDWNIYRLNGYREGLIPVDTGAAPVILPDRSENVFSLHVELDCSVFMPNILHVNIGISCVVEDTQGKFGYWALSHHGKSPDFHDERCFEIRL